MSRGYQRKIKSDIKKKLKILNELELPLLIESGYIRAIANCNAVTTNCNANYSLNTSKTENCAQNMVGRKGFEPSNPAMSSPESSFWERYEIYLANTVSTGTASDRILYAKKYYHILTFENASELLTLNNEKRNHVMKSLASLSKFLGCYDKWKQIRERYQLKWANGDSFTSFNNIMDNSTNYSSMVTWLKNAYSKLPREYGNVLLYCTLTGLRPTEATESVLLIHDEIDNYINKESMTLEHFRYPEIFIRRTKKAYISIVTDTILDVARNSGSYSYNAIKMLMMRNNIDMNMSYCRKIFATYLRMNQVEVEIIDLLQGRIPKSVFARHYYRPDLTQLDKIRSLLDTLCKKLVE